MNPESPKSGREQLEARITALLLGELSAEEAESLRKLIAQDSELSRLHYELKHAIELVRETVGPASHESAPQKETLTLSHDRREKLLQSFKVTRPNQFKAKRSKAERREWLAVAAMAIGLLVIGGGIVAYHRNEGTLGRAEHATILAGEVSAIVAPEAEPAATAKMSVQGGSAPTLLIANGEQSESATSSQTLTVTPPVAPVELYDSNPKPLALWKAERERESYMAITGLRGKGHVDISGKVVANSQSHIALPDLEEPVSKAITDFDGGNVGSTSGRKNSGSKDGAVLAGEFVPLSPAAAPSSNQKIGSGGGDLASAGASSLGIGSPASGRSSFSKRLHSLVEKKDQSLGDAVVADEAHQDGVGIPLSGKISDWQSVQMGRDIVPTTGLPALEPSLKQQITVSAVEKPNVEALQESTRSFGISEPISAGFFVTNAISQNGWVTDVGNVTPTIAANEFTADLWGNPTPHGLGGLAQEERKSQSTLYRAKLPQETDGDRAIRAEELQLFGSSTSGKQLVTDDDKKLGKGSQDAPGERIELTLDAAHPAEPGHIYDVNAVGYVNVDKNAQFTVVPKATFDGRPAKGTKEHVEIALPQIGQVGDREKPPTTPIVVGEINYNPPENRSSEKAVELSEAQKSAELAELDRQLENGRAVRDKLALRVRQEEVDASIPKSGIIDIIEPAEPQSAKNPTLWERVRGAVSGDVERSARVKVERDSGDVAGLGADTYGRSSFDPYWIQTEAETIQSKTVLSNVAQNLNLNTFWTEKHRGGEKLTTDEAVRRLKEITQVRQDPKTSLMEIRVKGDNAEESARIANEIAAAYSKTRLAQRKELNQRGVENLKTQLAEQEKTIARTEQELEQKRRELNIAQARKDRAQTIAKEADISQVLDDYQKLSGRTVMRPSSIPDTKMSIRYSTPLTRAETVQALDTILAMNQLVMIPLGEQSVKAVPQGQATTEGAQFEGVPTEALPDASKLATMVYKLTNATPAEAGRKIHDLVNLPNSIIPIPAIGAVIVRDYPENVKRAEQALRELDADRKDDNVAAGQRSSPPTPQPEIQSTENPFSTFSLNVSDVSFKLAAASLEKGVMPEPASVRSEEFINAFDYRDAEPPPGAPIAFYWDRARYPFAHNREIVRFAVKTAATGRQAGRPLNLVLLLDNSGSMERADRVRIIQECLRVLAKQLQPQDRVSVVAFSRTARLWVDGIPGNEASDLPKRVGTLTPQGGTNLEDAMNVAYQTALRHYITNGVNRVVLLTDGAANLGDVQPDSLKKKVEAHRMQGIALDCFGIGWEGYNDDLLEVLSRNGDGRYGFVNTPEAAATEFAGQLAGALQVAASDVKVQVEFNPRRVTTYRQIGYAKHQLKKEQFRDNTVDAAEIGAAEAGNALYVVQLDPRGEGPIATVRLRYKVPGTSEYHEKEWPVYYSGGAKPLEQSSPAMRLATVASAFSEWLVSSPYAAEVTPAQLLTYLAGVPETCNADPRPKKLEWMIRQAKSISGR